MGRKPLQVVWISFSMAVGIWGGRKLGQIFFYDHELKYRIWEETELNFWRFNGLPKHIEAQVEFESVINPGSNFKSFLPESGVVSFEEGLDKYDI